MTTRISTAARNASASAIAALLDAGAGAGKLEVRTGTQPATANTAATGTLLGTLTLSDPAFGTPVTGVVTAGAITGDTSADASGTAGWFRAYDSDSNPVLDGSVTATGGGGDLQLNSVSIVAGGTINVTSWTITMAAG
jgi:hypothetical protein